jgi:hypothetical protein
VTGLASLSGKCHCPPPGPGILPVWASDLLAWAVMLMILATFALCVRKGVRAGRPPGRKITPRPGSVTLTARPLTRRELEEG